MFVDPPKHTHMRNLTRPAFSGRAMAMYRPRIERLFYELVEQVAPRGSMDFQTDFAEILPRMVATELFGIPPSDMPNFEKWAADIVAFFKGDKVDKPAEEILESLGNLISYFKDLRVERTKILVKTY